MVIRGTAIEKNPTELGQRLFADGVMELVIDEQGRAWVCANGLLCPWLWAEHSELCNYADPRTSYRSRCIGDDPDTVTSFGWYTDTGELVEENSTDTEDVLAHIPPDRREEIANLLDAYQLQ